MCLTPYANSDFKVADKDIVCYKVVEKRANGIYNSPCIWFEYVIRVSYKDSVEFDFKRHKITKGMFHSYASWIDAGKQCKEWNGIYEPKIKYRVLKCIIPKGSVYIIGFFGSRFISSYASREIKILEELCIH